MGGGRRTWSCALGVSCVVLASACGKVDERLEPDGADDARVDAAVDTGFDASVDVVAEIAVDDAEAPPDVVTADAFDGMDAPRSASCPEAWWRGELDTLDEWRASDGSPVGGLTFVPGVSGRAFSFDGLGAMVSVPLTATTARVHGALTISAWVRLRSRPSVLAPLVQHWNDLGSILHRGYLLTINASGGARWDVSSTGDFTTPHWGSITETTADNAVVVAPSPLALGSWTHLAATFDGASHRLALHVDGVEVASVVTPFAEVLDPPEPILLGGGTAADRTLFTDGDLDEVMLFDRALTVAEIRSLAKGEPPCPTH